MENQNKKETIRDMKELMRFEGNDVQIVTDGKGNPLFELYSTGMALGYVNKRKNSTGKEYTSPYKSRIDKVLESAEITCVCQGVTQFLTESQLYNFMLEAKTDKCKSFKKWVTAEVLPQIRKTGGYLQRIEGESDEDFLRRGFSLLYETIEKQNRIIEEQKPIVDYANSIIASTDDGIDIATFAKLINDEKVFMGGRNKLFTYLKENGYLMKNNTPYQKFIDNGIFKVKYIQDKTYGARVGLKTLITGKGQAYLINKMRSKA
ncbi:phage antirepressor KilAC domain-containing protein [Clostridium sp. 3-3]|uniref:phage antirepressor KilAC domain-containing protein n=1 Tax=Clostridium sp. 3-3 TaxID=2070757 RepID=UPI000CDAF7A5|nr:phage antirepressor KilAC domain-containing protein [Clostridium sp. 3-3]POO86637.1 phage repressor protein/antirepressor Ant [Clostridium sp. 3-3]